MEADSYRVSSPAVVNVRVSSSLSTFVSEKRFHRSLTVSEFKCKLELIVGSPASCMDLELFTADDKFIGLLDQDDALLGSYPVDDGCRIHVIDKSGVKMGEFEDVSKVIKYEMSNEAYEKRTMESQCWRNSTGQCTSEKDSWASAFHQDLIIILDNSTSSHTSMKDSSPKDSARLFLKHSKLGLFNEEQRAKKELEMEQRHQEEKTRAEGILVGSRCEVLIAGQPTKRGTVMYVGQTEFKPGYWIGLKYDEPLGKHDGSVNGKRYFECQYKYGAFVKPQSVTVGDYPEEDYGLNDEI